MSKAEPSNVRSLNDLPAAVLNAFSDIFKLETDIADLTKQHIKPLGSQRTKRWRQIKAESGISREILAAGYRFFKIEKEAESFESDYERERVQEELKLAWSILQKGGILDFIDALEKIESSTDKSAPPPAGKQKAEKPPTDKVVPLRTTTKPRAEPTPAIQKDDDWNQAPNAADPAAMTDASTAGYDFNCGEKAAQLGEDFAVAFKKTGFHAASRRGKNFKAGFEAGAKARAKSLGAGKKIDLAPIGPVSPGPDEQAEPAPVVALESGETPLPVSIDEEAKAIAAEIDAFATVSTHAGDEPVAGAQVQGSITNEVMEEANV